MVKIPRSFGAVGLAAVATLSFGCRQTSPPPPAIKPAALYEADLVAVTTRINGYLAGHNPSNTPRGEIRDAVGTLAAAYGKIGAAAGPLRGKTGDIAYGVVASRAEDGLIVAGNLAGAVGTDPAANAEAPAILAGAMDDWAAYNDELATLPAVKLNGYHPRRWWLEPAWRAAATPRVKSDGSPPNNV